MAESPRFEYAYYQKDTVFGLMDERIASLTQEIVHCEESITLVSHEYQELKYGAMEAVSSSIIESSDQYAKALLDEVEEDRASLEILNSFLATLLAKARVDHPDRNSVLQDVSRKAQIFAFGTDSKSPKDKRFAVGLVFDALEIVTRLNALAIRTLSGKSGVTIKQAPIKGMPRMDQKTWEKYDGYYSHVKDVARITIECTTVAAFREAISAMFDDDGVDILDLKNRLDSTKWNPEDSGGYLDVMGNGRFKGSRHIFEVQFTLKAFLAIKNHIGHKAYRVARQLHAYELSMREYVGELSKDAVRGIECGVFTAIFLDGTTLPSGLQEALHAALTCDTCRVVKISMKNCDATGGNLSAVAYCSRPQMTVALYCVL